MTLWEWRRLHVGHAVMTTIIHAWLQLWKHRGLVEFRHKENWVRDGHQNLKDRCENKINTVKRWNMCFLEVYLLQHTMSHAALKPPSPLGTCCLLLTYPTTPPSSLFGNIWVPSALVQDTRGLDKALLSEALGIEMGCDVEWRLQSPCWTILHLRF